MKRTTNKKTAKRFVQAYVGGDRTDGDPVRIYLVDGQVPEETVCAYLKQRLGADLTLWPVDGTIYRAQWFDAKRDVFREMPVEIEPVK